jgi:hypothetical protein
MVRRSRTQRSQKIPNSAAPPAPEASPPLTETKAAERALQDPPLTPAASEPSDEMAALDAGWDEIS